MGVKYNTYCSMGTHLPKVKVCKAIQNEMADLEGPVISKRQQI